MRPRVLYTRDQQGGRAGRTRGRAVLRAAVPVLGAAAMTASGALSTMTTAAAAPQGTSSTAATGTVNLWGRNDIDVTPAMIKQFNASHPGLKVVFRPMKDADMPTELATAIRAGSAPDLVDMDDVYIPAFSREGALTDLTSFIQKMTFHKSLSPGHLTLGTYQGREYGVPYVADLSVLWYNKDLFRKAGLNPNDPPSTVGQLLTDAVAVNKLGGGVSGFSFAGDCPGCLAFTELPEIWAGGQHLIVGNLGHQRANVVGNKPLEQVLTVYHQLWADHLVPASDQTDNGSTWGDDFAAGKVGILPGGYAQEAVAAQKSPSEFADAPLPGPKGSYSTFDGGDDFVIPKGAKNVAGAEEFIQFVLEAKNQLQYPKLGYTPVRTDLLNASYRAKYAQDAVALQALAKGSVEFTLAYNNVFNVPDSPWVQMWDTAVYDGKISQAMKQGQSNIDTTLSSVSG